VAIATIETINQLAQANADYENKFGFIFIVCATGKSANEMLQLLLDRLQNTVAEELHIAMGEQQKISIIRLKIIDRGRFQFPQSEPNHHARFGYATGIPGKNISIRLQANRDGSWQTITQGITNADGRIPDLLPPSKDLKPDSYKMVFDTGKYYGFANQNLYPKVEIIFETFDETHYHVPLLVNPFGYSTYRGS
jgi:5-hydroxyisourate hydrolase/2-oxo-4-hydroxy-4-carboxy-5-ureidoimidazoline decarboxylase